MSRRAKVLLVILLGGLAAGFLYLRVLARRVFFETPTHMERGARTRLTEAALESPAGRQVTVTLYFPSPETGTLLAETRPITWAAGEPDRMRQVLLALIEGSRQGYSAALPPSTDIRTVFLTPEGTAFVDVSNDVLADFAPGIRSESLAIYSIVNSLSVNIPAIKKVKILLQGREVETLHGHADLSEYFVPEPGRVAPAP